MYLYLQYHPNNFLFVIHLVEKKVFHQDRYESILNFEFEILFVVI